MPARTLRSGGKIPMTLAGREWTRREGLSATASARFAWAWLRSTRPARSQLSATGCFEIRRRIFVQDYHPVALQLCFPPRLRQSLPHQVEGRESKGEEGPK